MYGTIARLRARPGIQDELEAYSRDEDVLAIPGLVASYIYQSDADPNDYYLAVVFASKEAYIANATRPAQDARYRTLRALLVDDPAWHDGEIVSAHSTAVQTAG